MPGPGRLDDPDDRAQVARERREALGDGLLVADVGEDVPEYRQARAGLGRHVEPGLVHQRQQPQRAQGDGLAAGVRTGDHQRRVAVAETEVDRHDPAAQPRMAGAEEHDVGPIGRLRPDAVHLAPRRALAAQRSNRASAASVSRSATALAATSADSSSRIRSLLALGGLRLAPGVAQLDRDERLDEQGLAAARGVVDDALDPAPRIGLDRDDVAAVAQGDQRLLEGARALCLDEGLEPRRSRS